MNSKPYVLLLTLMSTISNVQAKNFTAEQLNVAKDIMWAADKVEVPRALLLAICWGEGSFRSDEKLTHMDGESLSHGTCQVKLATAQFMDEVFKHKSLATSRRLKDPKVNAFYAAKYLKYQLNRYKGNWQLATDAYNKGNAINNDTIYVRKVSKNIILVRKLAFLE